MKKKNTRIFYKTIKIEFDPDKNVEKIFLDNCRYRHWLYNKAVEYIKEQQKTHSDGQIKVNKYDLLYYLRHTYEFTSINRPDYLEEYDYYFRGIAECVVDDIETIVHTIIANRFKGKSSDIHFMKYDPNNISFRFKNKIRYNVKRTSTGNRFVLTESPYIIGLKINNSYEYPIGVNLRESFNKFEINIDDIKEISIKFHNEKWWLCLIVGYTYEFSKIKIKHRKTVVGIDLGETNPVTMYDGDFVALPDHLRFPKERLDKLENRLSRLQRVLDQKYNPEMDKFHQSKNYYKVLAKFHKVNERIVNIRKDWHFKLAHWIVTHYKNVVVDDFHDYIVNIDSEYSDRLRKNVNHSMFDKAMYVFNERLVYMCHKYGTNYYKPLMETTNTCSKCGNVNVHKLRIDEDHNERRFMCEKCLKDFDRDVNAAINCYKAFEHGDITT